MFTSGWFGFLECLSVNDYEFQCGIQMGQFTLATTIFLLFLTHYVMNHLDEKNIVFAFHATLLLQNDADSCRLKDWLPLDAIDQVHKSHNAPIHTPQCTIHNRNVHISVLNGALWDMWQVHCEIGLLTGTQSSDELQSFDKNGRVPGYVAPFSFVLLNAKMFCLKYYTCYLAFIFTNTCYMPSCIFCLFTRNF